MSSENIDAEYARLADTDYLVRRCMTKSYQLFSILAPPLYTGFSLFRKGRGYLTINRILRATWLGGAVGRWPRTIKYSMYTLRAPRNCQRWYF